MRTKMLVVPILLAGFVSSLFVDPSFAACAAQKDTDKKEVGQPFQYIPKEVRTVMLEGLTARQARQDIPFNIFKTSFLPAQQALYIIFFLKMKNIDLGFAPGAASPAAADAAAAAAAQPKLKATFNLFLQFHKMENGAPTQIVKEVYVPAVIEAESAAFDSNKEEWYTVGYTLFPGNYLLAMAVTSYDLKKIGIQYCEFSLPDPKSFIKELETTPIFLLKEFKNTQAIEAKTELHKGFFAYSIAYITPNIENTIAPGDPLDVFYVILGAQSTEQNIYDIEVQYEVKKDEETAIRFQPTSYVSPLVSHVLPMKQTLRRIQDDKELTETRDLAAGNYTLNMKISDKISGNACAKKFDFTIK
jgi:hypothetical protein